MSGREGTEREREREPREERDSAIEHVKRETAGGSESAFCADSQQIGSLVGLLTAVTMQSEESAPPITPLRLEPSATSQKYEGMQAREEEGREPGRRKGERGRGCGRERERAGERERDETRRDETRRDETRRDETRAER